MEDNSLVTSALQAANFTISTLQVGRLTYNGSHYMLTVTTTVWVWWVCVIQMWGPFLCKWVNHGSVPVNLKCFSSTTSPHRTICIIRYWYCCTKMSEYYLSNGSSKLPGNLLTINSVVLHVTKLVQSHVMATHTRCHSIAVCMKDWFLNNLDCIIIWRRMTMVMLDGVRGMV